MKPVAVRAGGWAPRDGADARGRGGDGRQSDHGETEQTEKNAMRHQETSDGTWGLQDEGQPVALLWDVGIFNGFATLWVLRGASKRILGASSVEMPRPGV